MEPKAAEPPVAPGLLRSSSVVGSMTMLSRVLGLLRDMVFARVIGADALADAFFVAFKIPNFFRRLFAEGAFAQAFVPVLGEYREKGTPAAVKALLDSVAGVLGSSLIVLTVLVVIASPLVTALFAFGFWLDYPDKFNAASTMLRITFPYLMLISLTGLAGAILNSYDRFAVPAFTPVLLNITLIAAALVAAPWFDAPVYALAWGVLVAGVVQLLFQLPFLAQIDRLPNPKVDWRDDGVRRVLRLMVPAIFGVSVSQINLLLDTVIASFLPTGSISWLYYSDRLSELPLGVFGIAIATVILPSLSRQHAARTTEVFSRTLDWALRMVLLVAIPAAVALMMLAEPILATLFYYGDVMTPRDIGMATLSLQAYAIGLIAFMLIKVLAPGYFARQDMKTPVRIGVIALVTNMVLNLAFALPLHHYFGIGHVGLALATSLAAMLNAGLLFRGLYRFGIYHPSPGWPRFLLTLLGANLVMAMVLWGFTTYLDQWLLWSGWQRAGWMLLTCLSGMLVYTLFLLVGGIRPSHLRHR
ncbi:murein biosynthesis integral membrane protein MurJ [uncultured Porticoccus sp.]|uniref:murein biosynthesis integral membrane protein MurJ n=1 Tax=uncultured Porticoccus sp. TaxID=1256050 RepID=UPI002634A138|nr:murein biosynthesis integral membrane protein MurJ [uncultured Porticoccus sp.]